jgi:hypothetical protein
VESVMVEVDGQAVGCILADSRFTDGVAEVTVPGLAPATLYSLRCRCELVDGDVDPEALWTPNQTVATAAGGTTLQEKSTDLAQLRA